MCMYIFRYIVAFFFFLLLHVPRKSLLRNSFTRSRPMFLPGPPLTLATRSHMSSCCNRCGTQPAISDSMQCSKFLWGKILKQQQQTMQTGGTAHAAVTVEQSQQHLKVSQKVTENVATTATTTTTTMKTPERRPQPPMYIYVLYTHSTPKCKQPQLWPFKVAQARPLLQDIRLSVYSESSFCDSLFRIFYWFTQLLSLHTGQKVMADDQVLGVTVVPKVEHVQLPVWCHSWAITLANSISAHCQVQSLPQKRLAVTKHRIIFFLPQRASLGAIPRI